MSAMSDDDRRAWAYLAAVAEPPCAPLIALAARYGAVETARMIKARKLPAGNAAVLTATQARCETDSASTDLETAHRRGARLVTPEDDEWPGWALLALDQASTSARGGGPLALWVRGPASLGDASAVAVGLVGSRAATSYGTHVAGQLASGLADQGASVVSGGAYGIDGAAHRGALAAGGRTVAVLACGIDRDYPSGHARLLEEIGDHGLVVSEYPPGTTAAKHRFLTRNRLVAALSAALVVVEAGRRSGAANTAAWARNLGRPLGAVPGPITSAMSVGCHQMIADGQATLVIDAPSVLALVEATGHDNFVRSPATPIDGLPPEQFEVIEALPAHGGLRVEEIAFSAGKPVAAVLTALAVLEVRGLVDGSSGVWRLAESR
ncbi:DNA-processing protein DprA [Gordonia alkaliphila]|uniref:DNA-processing protein DprA n=1 Tax=Gordonia alkaliphila TaxID=1053547 RepID=UPI001FF32FE7|nr:DNA-processing protein DprA [Gordonia alkaliphila]MCK0440342.1 DNA-processing protein DprA [Gordonia alkaliphila]